LNDLFSKLSLLDFSLDSRIVLARGGQLVCQFKGMARRVTICNPFVVVFLCVIGYDNGKVVK